jgi:hypothetical protein
MPSDHPRPPSAPMTLRPETGLPRFRRNASLRLEDGAIIATDRHGQSRYFRLDGTEHAPARVRVFGIDKQGLMDHAGRLLAVWENAVWGGENMADFCIAAGIKWGVQDEPKLPPMRPDGIKMFDIPVLPMAGAFSSVGIVAFGASQVHAGPDIVTVPVMMSALTGSAISLVLWKIASRMTPEVAERRKRDMQEALAEARLDDEDL